MKCKCGQEIDDVLINPSFGTGVIYTGIYRQIVGSPPYGRRISTPAKIAKQMMKNLGFDRCWTCRILEKINW